MRPSGWSWGTRCSRFNTINIDRCCPSSPRIRRFLLLHHSTHCLRRTIYQFVSGVFQQPARRTTSKWLPYWSPVLRVLNDAADPLRNKEIYRRFEMTGEAKALLHEEKRDPEC